MVENSYRLVLFISGMSVKSAHAVENIKTICNAHLKDNFELEIIDISKDKTKAQEHGVFAIPTLIKLAPGAKRIMIGDLSDTPKVLKCLGLVN